MAPCEFVLTLTNPLRRSCVSKRSRCGAVRICLERGEPSAEIVRVEALSLWRRANLSWSRRTLCGDPACRSALAVAPCEFILSAANPLRRSCVSKRSRCGAVRICLDLGEPSAEIARLLSQSRGLGFDSPLVRGSSGLKIAAFKYKRSTRSVLLQLRLANRNF